MNGQSVPKREWKQMDGQIDGCDCITSLTNALGNKQCGTDVVTGMLWNSHHTDAVLSDKLTKNLIDTAVKPAATTVYH